MGYAPSPESPGPTSRLQQAPLDLPAEGGLDRLQRRKHHVPVAERTARGLWPARARAIGFGVHGHRACGPPFCINLEFPPKLGINLQRKRLQIPNQTYLEARNVWKFLPLI